MLSHRITRGKCQTRFSPFTASRSGGKGRHREKGEFHIQFNAIHSSLRFKERATDLQNNSAYSASGVTFFPPNLSSAGRLCQSGVCPDFPPRREKRLWGLEYVELLDGQVAVTFIYVVIWLPYAAMLRVEVMFPFFHLVPLAPRVSNARWMSNRVHFSLVAAHLRLAAAFINATVLYSQASLVAERNLSAAICFRFREETETAF